MKRFKAIVSHRLENVLKIYTGEAANWLAFVQRCRHELVKRHAMELRECNNVAVMNITGISDITATEESI